MLNGHVEAALDRYERSRVIAFHTCYAEVTSSITAGLMLSQLMFWRGVTLQAHPERDSWFYKSRDEWTEETRLSRREQEHARKRLRSLGILEERLEGMPARLWFRVNVSRLRQLLAENLPSDDDEYASPTDDSVAQDGDSRTNSASLPNRDLQPENPATTSWAETYQQAGLKQPNKIG